MYFDICKYLINIGQYLVKRKYIATYYTVLCTVRPDPLAPWAPSVHETNPKPCEKYCISQGKPCILIGNSI